MRALILISLLASGMLAFADADTDWSVAVQLQINALDYADQVSYWTNKHNDQQSAIAQKKFDAAWNKIRNTWGKTDLPYDKEDYEHYSKEQLFKKTVLLSGQSTHAEQENLACETRDAKPWIDCSAEGKARRDAVIAANTEPLSKTKKLWWKSLGGNYAKFADSLGDDSTPEESAKPAVPVAAPAKPVVAATPVPEAKKTHAAANLEELTGQEVTKIRVLDADTVSYDAINRSSSYTKHGCRFVVSGIENSDVFTKIASDDTSTTKWTVGAYAPGLPVDASAPGQSRESAVTECQSLVEDLAARCVDTIKRGHAFNPPGSVTLSGTDGKKIKVFPAIDGEKSAFECLTDNHFGMPEIADATGSQDKQHSTAAAAR